MSARSCRRYMAIRRSSMPRKRGSAIRWRISSTSGHSSSEGCIAFTRRTWGAVSGTERTRRFVPTRWSITAVDDTIGKQLRDRVEAFPLINEIRVYESIGFDDRFLVVMIPRPWRYELIEAWYPNTLWNPLGRDIVMFGDHEGFDGRTTYASIGGCYYAARLAVGEALNRERRQAAAGIPRETHPGYIMPVGVWNVREHVREALRRPPQCFPSMAATLAYLQTRLA